MKILHILNDGQDRLAAEIISLQSKDHEVTVIDLSKRELSYETIVDEIFSADRVVSW
ncbi:MAG: hypothetical protein WA610_00555 [Thermodesulfovibrionales bacterium]